ncbi:hypothetical protein VTO42DRAFT_3103 [Malbranchea cinnamomea]
MEVTKQSFYWHLPRMLNDLSRCCCVALDLEFSGIAGRSSAGNGNSGKGNPTIQERYQEVKAAAETYQILQIGLTFVEEDTENGIYTLRPYNLHLSPVLDPRLNVERSWSYQSSAVEFLMLNGFRMEAPFTDGIPYLSREEEEKAKRQLRERQARKAMISDIAADQLDEDAVAFLNRTREQINHCIRSGKFKREGYVNVPPAEELGSGSGHSGHFTLNNYQKRLVHQLVRAEFPDLVSLGKSTFVQILPYDKKREDGAQESRLKALGRRMSRQMGFRWIIEALVGGDISNLDPWCFAAVIDHPAGVDLNRVTAYSHQLREKLKRKRPVLVGHNLFVDLAYLYRTFIGPLPDKVEEFQREIHSLLPLVVDTKYMATHDCVSSKASSSLEDVSASLSQRKTPVFVTDSQYTRYAGEAALHEAGYDSLLTAQVFLRLSADLHERTLNKQLLSAPFGAADGGRTSNHTPKPQWKLMNSSLAPQPWNVNGGRKTDELIDIDEPGIVTCLASLDRTFQNNKKNAVTPPSSQSSQPQQAPVNWHEPAEVARIRSSFAHPTKFDLLTDQTEEELKFPPTRVIKYSPPNDPDEPLLDFSEKLAIREKVDNGELIPRFDDDFWRIYGNKLRIFGTAEEILNLEKRW